ncbi:RagB/SusD family nutrient uptake outer membrane protein [Sphingobacterium chuzhouense]|uniref:RagB/SusD family nutrient uptake outer membrane protein n=1 Tax=Sphingobacterium chuzhouense TaxID=1742264 RepID=A0ABR7XPV9_9SPHI|nr:RagB/SusD family nutrient uptake outer membrane protein [Sphingobacterium chuzhouense]MBD1421193.1 RagB/SusD family nutrient uptake outer membrane protein [Sphingobacterium chuzhouense]
MKNRFINYIFLGFVATGMAACSDYLNILPKGQKIPLTYADFEPLLRDEPGVHHTRTTQATILLNDRFVNASSLSYYRLWDANYFWREDVDRKELNNTDEDTYYQSYASIASCNLIIENGEEMTECTEQQRAELVATARVIRALNYFILANYYAAAYDANTANDKKAVPLILSADVGAPHTQVDIAQLYRFMIDELETALVDLPVAGLTVLHPGQGATQALLARIYLQMSNYPLALQHADKALQINNKLFDWLAYYELNKTRIDAPTDYTLKETPMNHSYVENYYFRHGNDASTYRTTEYNLRLDRIDRFEDGDAKFIARWKLRTVGPDTYYASMMTGYHNLQGLTTVEVYLIKAEALAREGRVGEAMDVLNTVRRTRILADKYEDLQTGDPVQAIKWIQRTKQNELIFSIVPFADVRRLNQEETYRSTMTKIEEGKTYILTPDSHLWIMPIPFGAIKNPGNGVIEQNVEK